MKKLIKISSGVAFVFLLSLTLSSFSSTTTATVNNGVIVEVIKGAEWYYAAGCSPVVYSTKSTNQIKNGTTHMITVIFQLPDGHCSIPEKKAYKTQIGPYTVNFTPSGTMIVKYKNNG